MTFREMRAFVKWYERSGAVVLALPCFTRIFDLIYC